MIYVAGSATLVGDVELGDDASVWYGAVLRADMDAIRIGRETNVQDNAVLHQDAGLPCVVGDRVTVGHGAVVHGCTVGDGCVVGMGSTICSGAELGDGAVTAAGCVVPEGMEVPPGRLALGVPAEIRDLPEALLARRDRAWRVYVEEARDQLPGVEDVARVLG